MPHIAVTAPDLVPMFETRPKRDYTSVIAGEEICTHGALLYDVFVKPFGVLGWHHGATVESAAIAMSCQNYVRCERSGTLVKIVSKPRFLQ